MHPRTPNAYEEMSKRAFDGRIKIWRKALHQWDNSEVRPDLQAASRESKVLSWKTMPAEEESESESKKRKSTDNNREKGSNKELKRNSLEDFSEAELQEFGQVKEEEETKKTAQIAEELEEESYSDLDVL